jgi:zinc transport system permease protein
MLTQTTFQIFGSSLFLHILLLAVLSSLLVSLSGVLIEYNNLSGVSGPIAHTILGGVGGALFLGVDPFIGALVVCILESIILAFVKIRIPRSLESISNALWGLGMSLGVLFLFLTPGYQQSLSNFLFGNILLVSHKDIIQSFILNLTVFFFIVLFSKQILVVMINIEFAKLQRSRTFFS